METLFVVEQHKNQYYSRSKSQGHARFGGSPSRGFRDINCRTFESGRTGILPSPLKSHGSPKLPPNSDYKTFGKVKVTPKSTLIPINGIACRRKESEDVPGGGGGDLLLSLLTKRVTATLRGWPRTSPATIPTLKAPSPSTALFCFPSASDFDGNKDDDDGCAIFFLRFVMEMEVDFVFIVFLFENMQMRCLL
ncbi:hypothetical protein V8G54_018451 [Vigna mungo]|uniref:Uncharacterized protein n=1 Tax=Vigna mungo TaxID=3915 RepID=A0AAQ3N8T9_VIGMU